MLDFVENFHSGWRYLVELATIATFLYFAFLLVTRTTNAQRQKMITLGWSIVVDIQVLLGIILLILWIADDARQVEGEQIGHITPMLLTLPVVHFYSFYARRFPGDHARLKLIGVAAPVATIALVVGGLASLGLGPFES